MITITTASPYFPETFIDVFLQKVLSTEPTIDRTLLDLHNVECPS